MMAYKRLSLTDITIPIGRGAKAKTVVNAWNAENVEGKWAATSWGKKLARRRPVPTILTASRAWSQARRLGRRSVLHSS